MSAHPGPVGQAAFEAVCPDCGTVAVTFEHAEGAFDDTPVFCGNCGRLRGVMGAIRKMVHDPANPAFSTSEKPAVAGNASVGNHDQKTPTKPAPSSTRHDHLEIGRQELDGRIGPPRRDPDREC